MNALMMLLLLITATAVRTEAAQPTTGPATTRNLPASQPSIVGTWTTGPVKSQLGELIITYDFQADKSLRVSTRRADGEGAEMSVHGTYEMTGDELILKRGDVEYKHVFTIEGDRLTLNEKLPGGEVVQLKRQPAATTQRR